MDKYKDRSDNKFVNKYEDGNIVIPSIDGYSVPTFFSNAVIIRALNHDDLVMLELSFGETDEVLMAQVRSSENLSKSSRHESQYEVVHRRLATIRLSKNVAQGLIEQLSSFLEP